MKFLDRFLGKKVDALITDRIKRLEQEVDALLHQQRLNNTDFMERVTRHNTLVEGYLTGFNQLLGDKRMTSDA